MTEEERYNRWVRTTDAYKLGRIDALEEAAKEAEGNWDAFEAARAIRALKEKAE